MTSFWRWQPHPEVWFLVLSLVGLYVYAIRVIGPKVVKDGPAATKKQIAAFAAPLTLWIASDWPLHDLAEEYLYFLHMSQHLLLTFIIPPLALLATPEWLARLILGDGRLHTLVRKAARPIPAAVVFNAVTIFTHWPEAVNTSVESGLVHYGVHVLVVFTAFMMWIPVCGPIPEMRISRPAAMIYLFLQSVVPTLPAAWLTFGEQPIYTAYDHADRLWGISVISDQQAAGGIMKLGGGGFLWVIILVMFFRWAAEDLKPGAGGAQTPARPASAAPDPGASAPSSPTDTGVPSRPEADAVLTYRDVEAAFEAAPDAPAEAPT